MSQAKQEINPHDLEKGDRFLADCHDKPLRVHSAGPFGGIIIVEAYDTDGAQWTVAEVDGQLYLGWNQLSPPERQTRAKEITRLRPYERVNREGDA